MKQGWEIKRMEEIAADVPYPIGDGDHGQIKPQNYSTDGIPYIRVGDMGWGEFIPKNMVYISDNVHKQNLKSKLIPGDILIAKTGATIGKCCIIPDTIKEANTTSSVGKITVDQNKVLPRWVLLYFLTPNFLKFIWSISNRAAQPGFNNRDIKLFEIPLPPLPEQQRIVAILDEAFAAIDKAKANAEENLKNAKELFESYLQGVFENGNWERKKWGDLCDFVRGPFGGSLKKNIFKEEGYVVYEQKHAIHDHFNQLRYFIDEDKFNEMKRFELFPGDIIMSCSGVTLGRVAIVPDGIKRGIINQALLKLTPKKNVSVHFIKHWLRSNIFQKIIFDFAGGAAIPNVPSAKILKDILIPFPSLKEQEQIVNEIETVLRETKRLEIIYEQKINDLVELKKSILQKAFSGEL
jgi:type I restriction enzyme S subunit